MSFTAISTHRDIVLTIVLARRAFFTRWRRRIVVVVVITSLPTSWHVVGDETMTCTTRLCKMPSIRHSISAFWCSDDVSSYDVSSSPCRRHDTVDINDRHRNVTAHNTYARYVILLTFTFRVFYAENMAFWSIFFARLVSLFGMYYTYESILSFFSEY